MIFFQSPRKFVANITGDLTEYTILLPDQKSLDIQCRVMIFSEFFLEEILGF